MKRLTEKVKKFVLERDWDKQEPDQIAKSIAIEAAELLELFQWANPTAKEIKENTAKLQELKGELADVLIYCSQLGLLLDLDLDKIVEEKLALAARKYPAKLMRLRSAGESLANRKYLEIKKKYRQKRE